MGQPAESIDLARLEPYQAVAGAVRQQQVARKANGGIVLHADQQAAENSVGGRFQLNDIARGDGIDGLGAESFAQAGLCNDQVPDQSPQLGRAERALDADLCRAGH